MMKKVVIAVVILALGGTAALFYVKGRNNGVRFKTARVSMGPLKAVVTATGTMNAVTTVLVGTQVSGTISRLYVDYNSHVKKGQVIAEIDPAAFEAQVDQARANLLVAKANVEKAKATLYDSRRTRDRNRELFSRSLIARSDLDTAEANHDANDALLAAAVAQVAQTEAALRLAETNLMYTKITSPVEGTVVSRNVDVGQTVAASFQTPTLFTIAQDLTKMQIDTNIDEADIGKIRLDQSAEFTVDAFPDMIFHGTVAQIRIAPTTVQNVVTYDVVVKLDNADMKLKPGMTANVSVVYADKERVARIPNVALRFRPTGKDGISQEPAAQDRDAAGRAPVMREQSGAERRPLANGGGSRPYVIWILENNIPKREPITIGISDGTLTEVTSGDLKEGQEVITESLAKGQKGDANGAPPPRFFR
jgi:HlyD family secretion protein